MGQQELLATVTELRGLRNMAAELAYQIAALEDIVKNEMTEQGVDKLYIGDCKVTWTKYMTSRFDSKAFKEDHEELYNQFTKKIEARRFSIS